MRPGTAVQQRARLATWFADHVPEGWFVGPLDILFDNDEILVVGRLSEQEGSGVDTDEGRRALEGDCIERFREQTREQRMVIAQLAEQHFRRRVSWGATCGETTWHFTTASVPVMTRLRLSERAVLDTLIDAGVARSRSEALAWCARLVGRHEREWIAQLRVAFEHVEQARAAGPKADRER
jgi:hypothetical protein